MTVDAVILTYKPTEKLIACLEKLLCQTVRIDKIYVVNTEEQYFHAFMYGRGFIEKHKNIQVSHLSRKEFNHGKTRDVAMRHSDADFVLMMTDDAIPEDEFLVERLVKAAAPSDVAASYARQKPNEDASEIEGFTRNFNYPAESCVKTLKDLDRLGIKTYFFSNVCAMYKKKVYEELGGFIKCTILNEDMIYAYTAMQKGYGIAYAADACVFHSHNYTNREQMRRNFDIAVSHADHPEIFEGIPPLGEGRKLVSMTAEYLRKIGKGSKVIGLYITSAYKYLGYRRGLRYKKYSQKKIYKYTMNREYWPQNARRRAVEGIDATKGYGRSAEEDGMRRAGL